MIPREVIDEIVDRADIVDTINTYVTLKRAGSNYNGLCPFHSEKSPSFTVFPATRSFYCFGCGAGGDVISFVMKAENLDYPSAVELLAQRVGVKIPEDDRRTYGGMKKDDGVSRRRIFAMNLEAAKFFRACLFDPKIGAEGMRYLRERQLSGATIKHFGLGFSPNGFGALTDYMHSKGFSDEELVEQLRENPYYQYFIGMPGYEDKYPFVPSLLVEFRKRLSEEILIEVNDI